MILLGAPGAGKGTQAEILTAKLGIPAISTGNILRAAVKEGTEMGLKAKSYMDAGGLVPDDVIIGILKERLSQPDCAKGFILDGVPRTIAQAEAIEKMGIRIDKVLDLAVDENVIFDRMSGRRVCEKCGASYHVRLYIQIHLYFQTISTPQASVPCYIHYQDQNTAYHCRLCQLIISNLHRSSMYYIIHLNSR